MDVVQLRALMAGYEKGVNDTLRFLSDALDAQSADQPTAKPPFTSVEPQYNLPPTPAPVNVAKEQPAAPDTTTTDASEPTTIDLTQKEMTLAEQFPNLQGSTAPTDSLRPFLDSGSKGIPTILEREEKITTIGELVAKTASQVMKIRDIKGTRMTALMNALEQFQDDLERRFGD